MSDYGFSLVMSLTRVPRTRIFNSIVKAELEKSYSSILRPAFIKYMNTVLLAGWRAFPEYKYEYSVRASRISVYFYVDLDSKMGKIFNWVDNGTGLEGPSKSTYSIDAVTAPSLVFDVPYNPATLPYSAPLRYDPSAESRVISTSHIDHPGIQARKFSVKAFKYFNTRRNPNSFYKVTENAYKRAIRRWQKTGSKPV